MTAGEVWEPIAFAQGDRVRVRLGGECPGMSVWHGTQEHGVVGTVIETDAKSTTVWESHPGHRYIVLFDRPLRAKGRAGDYAALELEAM